MILGAGIEEAIAEIQSGGLRDNAAMGPCSRKQNARANFSGLQRRCALHLDLGKREFQPASTSGMAEIGPAKGETT